VSRNGDNSRIRFWEDQEGSCPLCERPILDPLNRDHPDPEACNIDHKIPQSHGGTDARRNLQLTHIPCNLAKGCGCPDGDRLHLHGRLVQDTWRAQNFRCAICREPVAPSSINDAGKVKIVDGGLSHVPCLDDLYGAV
jgi:hypothetical protein